MYDREYYIAKAKQQRGLTDEEIAFFLQNHPRWDLLPVYARFVRKLGTEGALEEVVAMYGKDGQASESLDKKIHAAGRHIVQKHIEAFKELAKGED